METFHLNKIPLHSNLLVIGRSGTGRSTMVRHLLDALAPFDRRLLISPTYEYTQEYVPQFAAEEMHSRWREELGRAFIRQQLSANDCAMALCGSRGCLVLDDVDLRDLRPYPALVQLMAMEEKHRLQTTVMMTMQRVPSLVGQDHYNFMPRACIFLFGGALVSDMITLYFFSGANLFWRYTRFEEEIKTLAPHQCLVVVPSEGVYRYTVPVAGDRERAVVNAASAAFAASDSLQTQTADDDDLPEIDLRKHLTTTQVVGGVWVGETPPLPSSVAGDEESDEESDEETVTTAAAVLPPRRRWMWPF